MIDLVKNKRRGESYDVYIGRPSFWGNPIYLQDDSLMARRACLVAYWDWLTTTPEGQQRLDRVGELKDKTLGCWCAPKLCHGMILAQLANNGPDYVKPIIGMYRRILNAH